MVGVGSMGEGGSIKARAVKNMRGRTDSLVVIGFFAAGSCCYAGNNFGNGK